MRDIRYQCPDHGVFLRRVACQPGRAPNTEICAQCGKPCGRARKPKPNPRPCISVSVVVYARLKSFCDLHDVAVSGLVEQVVANDGVA